ncbi:MAG: TlpA family protein disulfide reductase [Planctomycetales bacterium]|nr:TlpA family protein disulfide reductase [bacterium]UNM08750.1 MAG: TlpA family protein disulfide reductase [Planctomycetales bacterium]
MLIKHFGKLMVLFAVFALCSSAYAQGTRRTTEKDYTFKAREIESGKMLEFSELTADKPLVLHVWAPDCPHCQRHMPYLSSLYKKLDHEKVNFVTYSVTGKTNDAQSFLKKRNLEFPTICLSNGSFSKDLKDGGWPNTMVFGVDGKLVGSCDINGPSYVETMEKLVEKAEEQFDELRAEQEAQAEEEANKESDGTNWFED